MDNYDEKIEHAVRNTEILRAPKQSLATFGTTNVYYYLLTEPVYSDMIEGPSETVIREGRVIAERPKIVTPYYLSHLEGFSSDARKYFQTLMHIHGPHAPGIYYTYKNEPKGFNIVSDKLAAVFSKISSEIEQRGDPLTSIIRGTDELWDVSLMKFIYEITKNSFQSNVAQMGSRGLLNMDSRGVPNDARVRIEELFSRVIAGDADPADLKKELDRWDLFEDYQDRFFNLFKKIS